MKLFLKWFFGTSGVIATNAPPKKLFQVGKYFIGYNSKPFRSYRPNGPNFEEYKYHGAILKRSIQEHKCQGCDVTFWGHKQGKYCGSWVCFKKVFGGTK